MTSAIVELFKHNLWSNLHLLDLCEKLTDEQLDTSLPGTYGSIRDTLMHQLGAEEGYLFRLTGQRPDPPLYAVQPFPTFDFLHERARQSGEAFIKLAAAFRPARILRGTFQEGPYKMQAVVPFLQAIHHAHEHRTHVMTILGSLGIEVPDHDVWAFGNETGLGP